MEKHYYDAASLERTLHAFEDGYGRSSADFYRAHLAGEDAIEDMPGFHRQAWAGFYAEWRSLTGNSFADRIERDLELA